MPDRKIKVLVVDDQKSMKDFYVRFLSRQGGFEVEAAESGEEALRQYEEKRPDVVILDLGLPDMDGAEVFNEMKELDSEVVIGILSGHEDRKAELLGMGAEGFFSKPVIPPELIKWVKDVVAGK